MTKPYTTAGNDLKNDFTNTGISSITVSWKQDVEPKLLQLQERGLDMQVKRLRILTDKGNQTCMYEVTQGGELYFRTNTIAAVWMFLIGLWRSAELVTQIKPAVPAKLNLNKFELPSTLFLRDVILCQAYDGDREKCISWWNYAQSVLQEKVDEKRIPARSGISLDQTIADMQEAFRMVEEDKRRYEYALKQAEANGCKADVVFVPHG